MATALEELERLRTGQGDEPAPVSPAMRALQQLRDEQEPSPVQTPEEAGKRAKETFQCAMDLGVLLENAADLTEKEPLAPVLPGDMPQPQPVKPEEIPEWVADVVAVFGATLPGAVGTWWLGVPAVNRLQDRPGFGEALQKRVAQRRRVSITRIPTGAWPPPGLPGPSYWPPGVERPPQRWPIPPEVPFIGRGRDPVFELFSVWTNMVLLGGGIPAAEAAAPAIAPAAEITARTVAAAVGQQASHTAALFGSIGFAAKMQETGGDVGQSLEAGAQNAVLGAGAGLVFGVALNAAQIHALYLNRSVVVAHRALQKAGVSGNQAAYIKAKSRYLKAAGKVFRETDDVGGLQAVAQQTTKLSALKERIARKKVLEASDKLLAEMKSWRISGQGGFEMTGVAARPLVGETAAIVRPLNLALGESPAADAFRRLMEIPQVTVPAQISPTLLAPRAEVARPAVTPTPRVPVPAAAAIPEAARALAAAPAIPPAPAPPIPAPIVPSDEVGVMKIPTFRQVISAFRYFGQTLKTARKVVLEVGLEPAKVTELSLGKGTVADIYRGTRGKTDVAIAEFNARELEAVDITVDELDRYLYENYTPAENENFTIAYRGRPTSGVAQTIAREAEAALPKELKDPRLREAVQEVSDANYDAGVKVAEQIDAMRRKGPRLFQQLEMEDWAEKSLGYFEDYFYGQWDDGPTMTVKEFFTNVWPTTEAWTKHKSIPSPADGVAAGLRLRKPSIIENLRAERISIARMEGAVWERAQAYKNGEGVYVVTDTPENRASHPGWRKLSESVFKDDLFHPDYATLHDNLVSFNKVMTDPALSKFRTFANFARFWRLWIPMFHEINTIKSQVTDFVALMWRTRTPALTPTGLARKLGKDPVFDINKPLYRRYVEHGGSHRTSGEYEAMTQVSQVAEGIAKRLIGSKAVNALKWANVLKKFRTYLFDYQIPHIKFTSWAAKVAQREAALGRELTPAEDQEIIKDVQALYGEMNEAILGRSGTMTSALRLPYTAPGYSEGNFRVQYDSLFHWTGGRGTHARYYIPLALAMSAVISHIGTRIMAGYWKPWPTSANELYDWFFFLDTGVKDDKGRKVGANVGTYEKDFYTLYGNVSGAAIEAAQGRDPIPELGKIPATVAQRVTGMTGALAEVAADLGNIAVGNAVFDYYGNRVMPIYDPFTKKATKLALHELKRLTPIVGSVYSQARNRGAGRALAAIEALLGVRLTLTQDEREKSERLRTMYALKEDGEKMYRFLASRPESEIPGLVQEYLENVENIIDIFPEEERETLRARFQISRLKNIRRALFGVALSERTPEAKAEATKKILSTLTVKEE